MSTHNIRFHDKIRTFKSICFLELSEEFRGYSKTISIKPWLNSHRCSSYRGSTVVGIIIVKIKFTLLTLSIRTDIPEQTV